MEDSLDLDNRVGWTGPLRGTGDFAPEGCVVELVNENTEESRGLFVGVGLKLGADIDDKRGGNRREQTGLYQ